MKSRLLRFLGASTASLLLVGAGCSSNTNVQGSNTYPENNTIPSETTTPENTTPSETSTSPVVTSTPSPISTSTSLSVGTVKAKIKNYSFQPKVITIKAGSTIVWTNNDTVGHTVTADDSSFDSGNISSNKTYSRKFTTPGTFTYHCTLHPYMEGTIIVE